MIAQVTSLPLNASTCIAGAVAGLVLYYLLAAHFCPLQDIKGPVLARYTRLWELYQNWRGQFEHVTVALHKEYGCSISQP
jgi:hypothetical protein